MAYEPDYIVMHHEIDAQLKRWLPTLTLDVLGRARIGDLHEHYRQWARDSAQWACSAEALSKALVRAGYPKVRVVGLLHFAGLSVPGAGVAVASNDVADNVGAWVGARCIGDPRAATLSTDLYRDYRQYCEGHEWRVHSHKAVSGFLEARGYLRLRITSGRAHRGIRLRTAADAAL